MSRLKIKNGVIMQGLQVAMQPVLIEAAQLWDEEGEQLVVTSALDGEHSPGSLHYYGYALDFRTRYFDDRVAVRAARMLQERLNSTSLLGDVDTHGLYTVIFERTHIHVQYNGVTHVY